MFPICKNQGGGALFWCLEVSMTKMGAILQIVPLGVMQRQWTVKTLKEIIPRTIVFPCGWSFFGVEFWDKIVFFSERCRLYTPEEFNMEHENDGFQEGISFSRGLFSGSMLNTWDVSVLSNSGWWSFQIVWDSWRFGERWWQQVVTFSLQFVRFSRWWQLNF